MNNKSVSSYLKGRSLRQAPTTLTTLMMTTLMMTALLALAGPNVLAAAHQPNLLKAPLSFEVNQGQTDPTVKFLSHGDGYTLFLTPREAVLHLKGNSSVVRMQLMGASPAAQVSGVEKLPGVANYLIGSDPAKWRTGISTYGKVHYENTYPGIDAVFYGNQRQLEYDFVVAPGADPSRISLGLSGVQPTFDADGNVILKLTGGNLALKKPIVYQGTGDQKTIIPANYVIAGNTVRFHLGKYDHKQTLVIDPVLDYLTYFGGSGYDIIGQNLQGSSNPVAQAIALDPSGNIIVTGLTQSTDFPTRNAFQPQNLTAAPPNQTAFVAEFNPSGTGLIYSTYLGGTYKDQAYAVAVDSNGSAYVTGSAQSPDFPTTPGAFQRRCGAHQGNNNTQVTNCGSGLTNAFLSKLDSTGALVYSTFLGGGSGSYGSSVAVDSNGKAYIAGFSQDSCNSTYGSSYIEQCFPETTNALLSQSLYDQATYPFPVYVFQAGAAFVAVFDSAGANLQYSTLYGEQNPSTNSPTSSTATYGVGVAVDPSFNFYLTGYTGNPEIPTTAGSFQPTYNFYRVGYANPTRSFVAKFSPVTGIAAGANLVYATYLGGTGGAGPIADDGNEFASGIAADAAGNAYITGLTTSYDFPVTEGATCSSCENIAFLSKLGPDGSGLVWSTLVGGVQTGGNGWVSNIGPPRLDFANNVYVTGEAVGGGGYPLVNPVQTPPQRQQPGIFATMFDPSGSTMLFSTLIYSPAGLGVYPAGIDVDSLGNVYLAGNTAALDLPTTPAVFQPALDAGWDAIVAHIDLQLPDLTIAISDSGNFTQAQAGATYALTVANQGESATTGTVTVTESVPAGLTVISMAGDGWTCTTLPVCTRADALGISSNYPPITVTVNVAPDAPSSVTNAACVSGGGQSNTSNDRATDATNISGVLTTRSNPS